MVRRDSPTFQQFDDKAGVNMAITRVYLTEEGADLLAKAQIGSEIAFTRAEVGEGLPPAGTVITQMTSLVHPVKEI